MVDDTRTEDALLTLAFSLQSNPGAYALLIGAGVSKPSGIPTAWDVLKDLVLQTAEISGGEIGDSMRWYKTTYSNDPEYETILEKLAPTQMERQRLLKSYFEPTPEELESGAKAPTAAHRAIARLVRSGVIKVIITLNFDRLIERAIRDENIEPTIVATEADIAGLAPLHTLQCCIIHLHGDYLNPTSMRNTKTELSSYTPTTKTLLQKVFGDYGLIIAGWSSKYDPALRNAISEFYPSRFTLAWIEPNAPEQEADDLRTAKKGLLLPADADAGFGRIADAVEALATRRARHPLTIAVAVETAKRELAGQKTAIALHDTLGREFIRLHAMPELHLDNYNRSYLTEEMNAIRSRVEEGARVATALVATLAFWGGADTDEWWIGELERFSNPVRDSGYSDLLELPVVAGTALYYGAGVAAVAARRYELLGRLFALKRPRPFGPELEPLADGLGDSVTNPLRRRVHHVVAPLLHEALAVGTGPIDDAWQTFEILRLTKLLLFNPGFEERAEEYRSAVGALEVALYSFKEAERPIQRKPAHAVRLPQRPKPTAKLSDALRISCPSGSSTYSR